MANFRVLFILAISCFLGAKAGAAEVKFDQRGISSIQNGGVEVLADGAIGVRSKSTWPEGGDAKPSSAKSSFDQGSKRLTETFDWGTIECTYRLAAGRINLDVQVNNTGKDSIRTLELVLLRLKLPGADKNKFGVPWPQPMNLADAPQIVTVNYADGAVVLCGEDIDRPLGLRVVPDGGSDEYAMILHHEGPPGGDALIGNGDRRTFHVSIRFGPKDADAISLAPDLFKRFAQRFPRQMKWSDHRPIGTINLATSAMGVKKNPRGWFQDRTNTDVTTPAGVEAFHEHLLKYADDCAHFAKDMNAQGLIVWDIEGQEMPHMISYIGDPRLMDQLAPEMSGVADRFMQKFKDGGLRVGVTIRPSHVVKSAGAKDALEHLQPADPVEEISEKIDYAKKRWGCTLFYIDSTVQWVNESDGKLELKTMPAEYFQILNSRFPDSLLIPEESTIRHWAYTAPYHEVQQGFTGTPRAVRACYPDAFTVIRVVDAGMDVIRQKHNDLVAGVRSGDILLYRTWFNDEYDAEVKSIYHDASRSKASPPLARN